MQTLNIQKNIPLAPYTTLGVGGQAEYFFEATNEDELREAVVWAREEAHAITILGGGSNVLVHDEGVKGLVLRICFTEIQYTTLDSLSIEVTVGSGMHLDSLIQELVEKNIWGLENLSAIPGTVGASPVQNVGAYGVEVGDLISSVAVYDTLTDTIQNFSHDTCAFAYRDSLFKKAEGKRYIILNVTFILSKKENAHVAYKDLQMYFNAEAVTDIHRIREAIIHIRAQKFPDYSVQGTAGSFFKNPIISNESYAEILKTYPELPGFVEPNGMTKISLGWALDKICGLKGFKQGNVELYEKQALVLVCVKGTSSSEIISFSDMVIEIVFKKIGIRIEREVLILK